MEPPPPPLVRSKSVYEDRLPKEEGWYVDAPAEHHYQQGLMCLKHTVEVLDGTMTSLQTLGRRLPLRYAKTVEVAGLSLSLATLHRLLYDYADDAVRRLTLACDSSDGDLLAAKTVLRFDLPPTPTKTSSRTKAVRATLGQRGDLSDVATAALGVVDGLRRKEALFELVTCLVDAAATLPVDSAAARSLPAPIGGVMMLLEYVSRALRVLQDALDDALAFDAASFPQRQIIFLAKRHHRNNFLFLAGGGHLFAFIGASCAKRENFSHHLGLSRTTPPQKNNLGGAFIVVPFIVVGGGLLTMDMVARHCVRNDIGDRLAEAKKALDVAIDVWCCVVSTLDEGLRLKRDGQSYCSLLNPSVRNLLSPPERCIYAAPVPPSLSYWWRLGSPWQVHVVGRGVVSWFAACFDASEVTGSTILFYPVAIIKLLHYFLLAPDAASRTAAAACSKPSIDWLHRVWAPADWGLVVSVMQAIEHRRGLILQEDVRIAGVRCFVCAVGDVAKKWKRLKRRWASDPHHRRKDDDVSEFDVVLHVHGGGFIAAMDAAHIRWLHELAIGANALVVAPRYSLAPIAVYPTAVDEVERVYTAIRMSGDLGLQTVEAYGLKSAAFYNAKAADQKTDAFRRLAMEIKRDFDDAPPSKRPRVMTVTCSAESAGACILASVVTRIAKEQKTTMPDALLLAYPPLNLYRCESPSRLIHLFDPLLPSSILTICSRAYGAPAETTDDFENDRESDLMSYFASDAILAEFPPTLLLCGGIDPLLDDAVDFHTRLQRSGVDAHLLVHRDLSHGFLGLLALGPLRPPTALTAARHAVRFLKRSADAVKSIPTSP